MASYVFIGNFTDQGARTIKDSPKRAAAVKEMGKKFKVDMKEIYWTMGQYDMVVVFEAADDASMSSFALAVAGAGNVRGQTLRAYKKDEFSAILGKIA